MVVSDGPFLAGYPNGYCTLLGVWGLGCSRSNPSLPHGEKLLNMVSAPAVTALPKSLLELKQAYLSLRLEQFCFVKKC